MRFSSLNKRAGLGAIITSLCLVTSNAQAKPSDYLPDNLPPVPQLDNYIKDKDAAIQLGKALFWDMQAGSQGQSCASCHFAAGADNRSKNQISPGLLHTNESLQNLFNHIDYPHLPSGGDGGPNYQLTKDDFPLYKLSDMNDRDSDIVYETDDVISSQGVSLAKFSGLNGNDYRSDFEDRREKCQTIPDIFHVNQLNTKRVEPRNTPTVINAVYNFRNFWDGRANNIFNGVDPFGPRNKDAYIYVYDYSSGKMKPEKANLINSSLASQAVGPPGSNFEMTCDGKPFQAMAKKLLSLRPLGLQEVHPADSALGEISAFPSPGLRLDYRKLIQTAFHDKLWKYPHRDEQGYSQIEKNFSLFWGLSIQMYESTLVSLGATRNEQGDDKLTAQELAGKQLFNSAQGTCVFCHSGPAFSSATRSLINPTGDVVNRIFVGPTTPTFPPGPQNRSAFSDTGFMNIGVRPTSEDLGLGGVDDFGNPLSFTRQAQALSSGGYAPDGQLLSGQLPPTAATAVDGAFKIPLLHNIELTGPYMHNGSLATLEEVVEFYNRGGNRRIVNQNPLQDSSGHNGTDSNLAFNLRPLGLTDEQKASLVAFMKTLTDERVRWEQAPFDHPQLFVPVGHFGDEHNVQDDGTGRAETEWLEIPSVGAAGRSAEQLPPVKGFLSEEPASAPKANDDTFNVKRGTRTTFNVLANDIAGDAPLGNQVIIGTEPNRRLGAVSVNPDGTLLYTALRDGESTFTYRVIDENGQASSSATVTVRASR